MALLEKATGRDGSGLLHGVGDVGETTDQRETFAHPSICSKLFGAGVSVVQPAALALTELLTAHGLADGWGSRIRQDKLAVIVHTVLEAMHRDARNKRADFFVPLHSKRIESLVGPHYAAPAVAALCALGVLEVNSRYRAGNFSKSFRLGARYRDGPFTLRRVSGAALAGKLRRCDDRENTEALESDPSRRFVWDNLQAVRLSPSADRAASREFATGGRALAWFMSERDLAQRSFWLRVDPHTGRIFHNVTQSPRELRRLLEIDGEPLAEVDIAGAQAFFALSLFPAGHPEIARYAAAVCSGDFYAALFERMPRAAREPWGGELSAWHAPTSEHRASFKEHVMKHVLYGVMRSGAEVPPVFAALAEISPWMACELSLRRQSKPGTRELAQRLQRAEADLVLGRVVPRIRAELHGCKPVTIHDSILCQRRFADDVDRILKAETAAQYGFAASTTVKRF